MKKVARVICRSHTTHTTTAASVTSSTARATDAPRTATTTVPPTTRTHTTTTSSSSSSHRPSSFALAAVASDTLHSRACVRGYKSVSTKTLHSTILASKNISVREYKSVSSTILASKNFGVRGYKSVSTKALHSTILASKNIHAVLDTLDANPSAVTLDTKLCALHRISKLTRTPNRVIYARIDTLVDDIAACLKDFDDRNASQFSMALANLRLRGRRELYNKLAEHAPRYFQDYSTQSLANFTSSMVKLKVDTRTLYKAVSEEVCRRSHELTPISISNLVWAFATVDFRDRVFFNTMAQISVPQIQQFNRADLTMLSWGFAKTGFAPQHPALFRGIADGIRENLVMFSPDQLPAFAWAIALSGVPCVPLFNKIAEFLGMVSLPYLLEMHFPMLATAFIKAGCYHREFFDRLETVTLSRFDLFTVQGVVNLLCAYASLPPIEGHADPTGQTLFTAFVSRRIDLIDKFSSRDLSQVAWAFAHKEMYDVGVFARIALAAEQCIKHASDRDTVQFAWAFSRMIDVFLTGSNGLALPSVDPPALCLSRCEALFPPLMAVVLNRERYLSLSDLATLSWAFVLARAQAAPAMLALVARAAPPLIENADSSDVLHILKLVQACEAIRGDTHGRFLSSIVQWCLRHFAVLKPSQAVDIIHALAATTTSFWPLVALLETNWAPPPQPPSSPASDNRPPNAISSTHSDHATHSPAARTQARECEQPRGDPHASVKLTDEVFFDFRSPSTPASPHPNHGGGDFGAQAATTSPLPHGDSQGFGSQAAATSSLPRGSSPQASPTFSRGGADGEHGGGDGDNALREMMAGSTVSFIQKQAAAFQFFMDLNPNTSTPPQRGTASSTSAPSPASQRSASGDDHTPATKAYTRASAPVAAGKDVLWRLDVHSLSKLAWALAVLDLERNPVLEVVMRVLVKKLEAGKRDHLAREATTDREDGFLRSIDLHSPWAVGEGNSSSSTRQNVSSVSYSLPFSDVSLQRIHQAHNTLRIAFNADGLPPELAAVTRNAFVAHQRSSHLMHVRNTVSTAARTLWKGPVGVDVQLDGYNVDVHVQDSGMAVLIFDRHCYMLSGVPHPTNATKIRHLRMLGLDVVVVKAHEWEALEYSEQSGYLQRVSMEDPLKFGTWKKPPPP